MTASMVMDNPRAQALNARAARERWPYTRVPDWLQRSAAADDMPRAPQWNAPAGWQAFDAPLTDTAETDPRVQALHAAPGEWNAGETTLEIPPDTQGTLVLWRHGDGVIDHALTLSLGAGAQLHVVRIATLEAAATVFEDIRVDVAEGAQLHWHDYNLHQGLSHVDLRIALNGTRAESHVDSLSLLDGRSRAVLQADITHAAPHAVSRLTVRNALAERARRSMRGMVRVNRAGQHTDSAQICRSLLLSPQAGADMRPELEIFADQVQCAHGATCGELDTTALHYLRSRGLDLATARRLLLDSFAMPLLDTLPASVRDAVRPLAETALARLGDHLEAQV
ncbi:MAG: SufD family Fe-S cluster assembly protein [Oceanococcaceae bacterium]